MKRLFTSESVTEGHPDKLCDYISDSILDSYLKKDKNARVACETVASKGEIYVTGEITSTANVNIEEVVRQAIKDIGYDNEKTDIDYRTCNIKINISKQSQDIALGVAKPVSVYVNTYGTNTIPEEEIANKVIGKFDLTPRGIINYLDLQKPIYTKTTNYGHFGKNELSWEKIISL